MGRAPGDVSAMTRTHFAGWRLVLIGAGMAFAVGAHAQKTPGGSTAPPPSLDAIVRSLPATPVPSLDEPRAQWLVAQPLACLDELQPRPANRPYFWEATFRPVDGYDKIRAFYGCGDWRTAVSATWTLAAVLKHQPELSVGRLIREKLADHLGKTNIDGEVAFFKDAGAFERPYGYVWFLTLGAEIQTWNDPEAAQWATNAAPLSKYFSDQLVAYLKDLDRAVRTGGQTNTALVLMLALDASETLHDYALRAAVIDYATKSYGKDTDCALDAAVSPGDLVSPCLSEAALMTRVLPPATFVPWLDAFLPPITSPKFTPLLTATTAPLGRTGGGGANRGAGAPAGAAGPPAPTPNPSAEGAPGRGRGGGAAAARTTPIVLALTRAEAFHRLALALPDADPRAAAFRRLAALHGDAGVRAVVDPAVVEAPWLGAFALRVMLLAPAR